MNSIASARPRLDEYRENVEKDAALERRFPEGTGRRTVDRRHVAILRGLKRALRRPPWRGDHRPGDRRRGTICRTVTLPTASCRTKRSTLIDEAASRISIEIDSKPEEDGPPGAPDDPTWKIEREALRKETDDASKKRLNVLETSTRRDRTRLRRPRRSLESRKSRAAGHAFNIRRNSSAPA